VVRGPDSRLGATAALLGGSVVVLVGGAFVVATGGYALGLGLGAWVLVVAALLQGAYVVAARRAAEPAGAWRWAALTVAGTAVVLASLGVVATRLPDSSIDGNHYHAASIRALADGWNPVRDPARPDRPANPLVSTNSYPKATWVLEAVTLRVTGEIEAGKVVGWALAGAAGLLAVGFLAGAGLRARLAVPLGFVAVASPVVTTELTTHMVDGVLSSLLLGAVMLALLWRFRPGARVVAIPLGLDLVLLVNTKQTGLVLAGLVVGGLLVAESLRDRERLRTVVVGLVATLAVGILLVGFNPYVTNTLRHGNPLYAVFGGKKEAGANFKTGAFRGQSPPVLLLRSLTSSSRSGPSASPHPKVPFTFTPNEWLQIRGPGNRVGGLGPWFSGVLLASAAIAVALVVRARKHGLRPEARALLVAAGLCVVATVVVPTSFVARFAPQLWLVPVLVLAAALVEPTRGWWRTAAVVVLCLLTVNAVGVGIATARWQVKTSDRQIASLDRLRRQPGVLDTQVRVWRHVTAAKLADAGVRYRLVRAVTCDRPFLLRADFRLERVARPHAPLAAGDALLCPAS
jgi:4-amino-4-deoxy-L-arabinose transferase-like glycosyltransferase